MSDRIAVMARGGVLQIASPKDLYERPQSIEVAAYLGDRSNFHVDVEGQPSPVSVAAQNVDEALVRQREASEQVWLAWREDALVLLPVA